MAYILQNVISDKFFCLDEQGIAYDTLHAQLATLFNSDEEIYYMLNRFREDPLEWRILTTNNCTEDIDLHSLTILKRADNLENLNNIQTTNAPDDWLEF